MTDVRFPKDSSAKILTSGLLGDQYVGLEPGADDKELAAGDVIRQTQSAVVLENLIGQMIFNKAAEAGEKTQPRRNEQPLSHSLAPAPAPRGSGRAAGRCWAWPTHKAPTIRWKAGIAACSASTRAWMPRCSKPVATGYTAVVPELVRIGVHNFFGNFVMAGRPSTSCCRPSPWPPRR